MQPMKFCQSCRLPLVPQVQGTEADGSKSESYCMYCYQNGAFTEELTMEDMITRRAPVFANSNPDMTIQEALDLLHELLPKLERWKTIG